MIIYSLPALFLDNKPIIVMHSHSSFSEKKIRAIRHLFLRPVLNLMVDIKLACSDKAGQWMFGKNSTFNVVPNGVITQNFLYNSQIRDKIRKRMGIKDNEIVIGSVGRLENVKNHIFLIDIMKKIGNNYKYIIVGSGPLHDNLMKNIIDYGLQNKVYIIENTPNVNEFYQAFDLLAMPSIFEGLPMTCVEAQFSGLPLILSDRISRDAELSDNVTFLPLQEDKWIEKIDSFKKNMNRSSIDCRLEKYDSKNIASYLTELFTEAQRIYKE